MSGSSPSSATTVTQNYPTWAGPNIPTDYGDNTAYDSTGGTPAQIGSNWIPMYLSAALKIENFENTSLHSYSGMHNDAYADSTGSATATVTTATIDGVAGAVQSVVVNNAVGLTSGMVMHIGDPSTIANPAIMMYMGGASSSSTIYGYGLTVREYESGGDTVKVDGIVNGGSYYVIGQQIQVLHTGLANVILTVQNVDSNGTVTAISSWGSGGTISSALPTVLYGTPLGYGGPISAIILHAGGQYTSANNPYDLVPYVPGQTFERFNNINVTDPASADGITRNTSQSKFAKLTTNEKDAMTKMALRGANGDDLAVHATTGTRDSLKDTLDGGKLAGASAGFPAMLTRSTGVAKTDFTNRIYSRLTAKAFINGDTSPSVYLGKELVTDAATETKWGDRYDKEMYNDNYITERSHQNNDISLAVSYSNMDYVNAEALRNAGLWNRQYVSGRLKDNYEMLYANETLRLKSLDVLGDAIGSTIGMRTDATKPYMRPSGWTSLIGGAMSGAVSGSMINGPTGAVIGGSIGAVAGLLGAQDAAF